MVEDPTLGKEIGTDADEPRSDDLAERPREERGDDADQASDRPWAPEVLPYLEKLAIHLRKRDASDHSVSVPIGIDRVLVSPFEQRLALADEPDPETGLEPADVLVRDGLGMQVKIYADLRVHSKSEGAERVKVLGTLRRDAELGQELEYEMHQHVSAMSKAGELERARQYATYRQGVRKAVERAAAVVEGSTAAAAGSAVADPKELSVSEAEWEKAKKKAAAKKEWESRKRARADKKQRTRRNLVILAVVVALLGGALVRLWMYMPKELEQFTESDLNNIPGVEQVINRPPGLVVVVSFDSWTGLSRDEKLRRLGLVVDKVQIAGYRRVEFRSSGGRSGLAVWEKGRDMVVQN